MRALKHPKAEYIELTRVLYALSDPVRLGVVRQLAREGEATCAALDGGHTLPPGCRCTAGTSKNAADG